MWVKKNFDPKTIWSKKICVQKTGSNKTLGQKQDKADKDKCHQGKGLDILRNLLGTSYISEQVAR